MVLESYHKPELECPKKGYGTGMSLQLVPVMQKPAHLAAATATAFIPTACKECIPGPHIVLPFGVCYGVLLGISTIESTKENTLAGSGMHCCFETRVRARHLYIGPAKQQGPLRKDCENEAVPHVS